MVQFVGLRSAIVIYDRERDILSTLTPERGPVLLSRSGRRTDTGSPSAACGRRGRR